MTERIYPEIIIFTGIPASGKSTFYQQNFAATHIHISLDDLHTRNQENKMLEESLTSGKSCVIDNTNVTADERAKYIEAGKRFGYKVIGYYFRSSIDECRIRNDRRQGKKQVSEVALRNKAAHLECPSKKEGFDELYYVKIVDDKFETTQYDEV
jgi:predicted kinase